MKWILPSALVLFFSAGCTADTSVPAVENLDLSKYAGLWYETARLPNPFEKGMTDVRAEYTLLKTGLLCVVNSGDVNGQKRSVSAVARRKKGGAQGELEVAFFRPFYSPYRVIKLAPDHRYSVVMGRSKKLLWVLSRQKRLPPADWQEVRAFLKKHGFPVRELIYSQSKESSGAAQSAAGQ